MRDHTLGTHPATPVPLGPRLAGMAILCVGLFALATVAGLLANALA